jgi:hypothetical protein
VLNLDCVQQVSNAARRHQFADCILRNSAGANAARSPNQNTLHGIANNLARNVARSTNSRSIKPSPFPIRRIAAGGVHGGLEATGQRLADLVARHERPLTMFRAGRMKLELLGYGL